MSALSSSQDAVDPNESILDGLVIAAGDGDVPALLRAIDQGVPAKLGRHAVSRIMTSACWGNHVAAVIAWLPVFVPGYSLKSKDSAHDDALEVASSKGYAEVVDLLLPLYRPGEELDMGLYSACLAGHPRIVKTLLAAGANPRAVRNSSLVVATRKNHLEIVALLAPLCDIPSVLPQCASSRGEGLKALIAYQEANQLAAETPLNESPQIPSPRRF